MGSYGYLLQILYLDLQWGRNVITISCLSINEVENCYKFMVFVGVSFCD